MLLAALGRTASGPTQATGRGGCARQRGVRELHGTPTTIESGRSESLPWPAGQVASTTEYSHFTAGEPALWIITPSMLVGLARPFEPSERNDLLQVFVRDNNVDQALRVLKKKMQREGVFREMKRRRAYEKPSDKAARRKNEAIRRARKLARKQAQREGLIPAPRKKDLRAGKAVGYRPSPNPR